MRIPRRLALGASILASLAIVGSAGGGAIVSAQDQPTVRIGSDGFYESQLMAEIYAQALEAEGFGVERLLAIGTREVRNDAFTSGQIDLVPEYVGSGLSFWILGAEDPELAAIEVSGDGETNRAGLQQALDLSGVEATVLAISAGEDTNAAVVRSDTAEELGLTSIGDLAAVADQVTFGLPPECEERALCRGALEDGYGIAWPPAQLELLPPCGAEMAGALEGNAIDVAWLCSTQPVIAKNGWVVLEDDLDTQPAENLAPVVRNDFLEQVEGGADAMAAILDPVSAAVTTDVLTELGARVAIDQEDIEDVAADFLASLGS
ncbi:MAG: ABC transporter substrate-binding protein [Chloroflexota bacterium]|jgi:osmoprotectant transport system substrate-binding protein